MRRKTIKKIDRRVFKKTANRVAAKNMTSRSMMRGGFHF